MQAKAEKVCFAGEGWGAKAALKSLTHCNFSIDLMSNDDSLKEMVSGARHISRFEDSEARLVVCAGYKPLIPKTLLSAKTFVNVHYSLLPRYRGLHSTVWAILNDEDWLGVTIHEMNENMDDGPIIYQHAVQNNRISTATDFIQMFNEWVGENLGLILQQYLGQEILPTPQDKKQATWVGKRSIDDCKIDFQRTNYYLRSFFRALSSPYPAPFFTTRSRERYSVLKVAFHDQTCDTHVGRILNIDNDGVWVKTGDGYMILKEIVDNNFQRVSFDRFKIGMYLT
ncbi:methionyl-tRNA formyltransferase [Pedobacter sp. SYSU D00535]|uniref:methionyl-tRNA formyltransferase n=1 Tax=Pedobacter sp. SYSU D00535 TaxID=2810308 RepID=UPI001A9598CF|nr:formyltransferase family protein [Pedobacter sp. SYSU D00535]